MAGIAVSLILMVVVPTIIGVGLNEISRGKAPRLLDPYLGPFSKVCLLLVITSNTAAISSQVHFDDVRVWIIAAVSIGFSVLGFICAWLAGILGKFNREKRTTLLFALGLRNTSAAMTLGIEFFPPQAALPAVLGIIFQQTLAALMGKLLLGRAKKK
jgi:tagaturonate reductase